MAKLKASQLKNLDSVLIEKDLIQMLEEHLKNNNIHDIGIEFIKFKRNDLPSSNKKSIAIDGCGPGTKRRLVCTLNGKCEYICVDI
ncbi:hypothetical protein [Flavobacterium sp. PS2]|uniref:hypothetical protein n=1 Tax=Flavobacterium sp. PS2 TaxID=3384157 RepID=UPI00390C46D3